jgi:hypothetical protein
MASICSPPKAFRRAASAFLEAGKERNERSMFFARSLRVLFVNIAFSPVSPEDPAAFRV